MSLIIFLKSRLIFFFFLIHCDHKLKYTKRVKRKVVNSIKVDKNFTRRKQACKWNFIAFFISFYFAYSCELYSEFSLFYRLIKFVSYDRSSFFKIKTN